MHINHRICYYENIQTFFMQTDKLNGKVVIASSFRDSSAYQLLMDRTCYKRIERCNFRLKSRFRLKEFYFISLYRNYGCMTHHFHHDILTR